MLQLLTGLICKWNSGTWHEHNVLAEDTETQLICLISHFMSLSPFLRGTAVAGRYVVSTAMLPLQSLTRSPPPPCKLTTIFSVRSEITQTKACLENISLRSFYQKALTCKCTRKKNTSGLAGPQVLCYPQKHIMKTLVQMAPGLLLLFKHKHYKKHYKESIPDAISQKSEDESTVCGGIPTFAH